MPDKVATYDGFPVAMTDKMIDGLAIAWTCPRCGGTLREWQRLNAMRFQTTIIAHMQGHAEDDEAFAMIVESAP